MVSKLLLFVLAYSYSFAQFPQGYFIMPINPGKPVSLSGAFGDIRINHFHAGLDIRTGGQEGKPVYAAAEGYVSRIKIQNGGYGNALYITHPNGYTTVYAHLKTLNDTLQKYLISKQYELKTWEIDLALNASDFKIRQGELVALSGNTGGSGGPHLHFEIRDKNEDILDPSQFGFVELKDTAPPVIEYVSLKTMSADARINGRFGLFNFPVKKMPNGKYLLNSPVEATGLIGLELYTYDKTSNSTFRQGINQIIVRENHQLAYNFQANKFSFSNRLDMNCHVNYGKLIKAGVKIHKCYVSEGNSMNNYVTNDRKGLIQIVKDSTRIDVSVNDAFFNKVDLSFLLIKKSINPVSKPTDTPTLICQDNFLSVQTPNTAGNEIQINHASYNQIISIPNDSGKVFTCVYDLKNGIPNEIKVGENFMPMPVNMALKAGNTQYNQGPLKISGENALYQTNYLNTYVDYQRLDLHEDIIPLRSSLKIEWNKSSLPSYPEKYKVYLDGKKPKFIGGEWVKNVIKFNAKEYGSYICLYDFDPPAINARIINNDKIALVIKDDISGIKSIEASLNDEWLLMLYEYKNGLIWAEKRDASKPFEGNLVVKITDNCNNTQIYTNTIAPKL